MKRSLATYICKLRIRQDIKDIREVIALTEKHLQVKLKLLRASVSAQIKNAATEEEADFLMGWHDDDFVRLDKIYPNIQRRALFTTLMSMTEANMLVCCRIYQRMLGVPAFKSKGRDRKIEQMLEYLKRYLSIRDRQLTPYWRQLNELWTVRNALVHNDGIPRPSELETISRICASLPKFEMDDRKRIVLKPGSVEMALHIVDQFFSRLVDEFKRNESTITAAHNILPKKQ